MPNIDFIVVILNALITLERASRDTRYLLERLKEVRAWVERKRQQHHKDNVG